MGQARQRQISDPLYGKIKKEVRGLIINNPTSIEGNSFSILSSNLDPQDLRSSLLYWDRLAWPSISMFRTTLSPDEEYLQTSGILQRPEYPAFGRGEIGNLYKNIYLQSIQHFEENSPGLWSIGNSTNSLLIHGGASSEATGTLLQLLNAAPVPSAEVPLAEILEFKQKRRPELLLFRSYFDDLANEIQGSSDSVDMLKRKLADVDEACSNLVRVTSEWQFPVKLTNLNASLNFNISKAMTRAVGAWKAASEFGLGESTAAIAGVLAGVESQFKISPDISFAPMRKGMSPYRYAYLVQRDLK